MKIAVIGAGAMGCLYGAYLSEKNEVIMIDSYQPQVDAINENGITIVEEDKSEHVYKNVTACLSGEYKEAADWVIVFVKSNYTDSALEANALIFGKNTIVMTLQNGAGNDRKISKYVDPENIIIGTSTHNSVNLGGGKIFHGGLGITTIGSNHNAKKYLGKLRETLSAANFETVVSDDIQRIIWSKLFVNLSINTFTAITGTTIGYMIEDEYAWNFAKRLVYEAVAVAEEDGTYFDRREVMESIREVCVKLKNGYSSMYQDRKKGLKTEIDAINGAVVEQAKIYGVPVPYNSLIVDLVHAIEGGDAFNRSLSEE